MSQKEQRSQKKHILPAMMPGKAGNRAKLSHYKVPERIEARPCEMYVLCISTWLSICMCCALSKYRAKRAGELSLGITTLRWLWALRTHTFVFGWSLAFLSVLVCHLAKSPANLPPHVHPHLRPSLNRSPQCIFTSPPLS